jgi:hypothetical protein
MELEKSHTDKLIAERLRELARQRREIIGLPPEKALEAILNSPQPAALVHSFAEEDFYSLVHEIGPQDALPLLKLASDRQWEYLLDVDTWYKDRVHLPELTRWLDLMLKADPKRLVRACLTQMREPFALYLFRNIELKIRQHDQSPSEIGDDFFTDDEAYYLKLIEFPAADPEAQAAKQIRSELLPELLRRISAFDHMDYQNLLLEASALIPAEMEEELYRLRNARLAEKGFLPFDEAVGVYQPLLPEAIGRKGEKRIPPDAGERQMLPVPLSSSNLLAGDDLFARALKSLTSPALLQLLQTEFAGLCNQVIAADQKPIRQRQALAQVVKKVSGFLSIGLAALLPDEEKDDPQRAAAFIGRYFLSEILRVGYGQILAEKWRVEKWRRQSWFQGAGLPLSFWGEQWLGVLGGLLVKKPLFFDNYASGSLYRDFASRQDIKATRRILDTVIVWDGFLALMGIDLEHLKAYRFLTYKNLLLTLWADHHSGLWPAAKKPLPLPLKDFRRFFDTLWEGPAHARRISPRVKEAFLGWLAERSGWEPFEVSQRLGNTLELLFAEIESELAPVAAKDLDPRYIHHFLIEKDQRAPGKRAP